MASIVVEEVNLQLKLRLKVVPGDGAKRGTSGLAKSLIGFSADEPPDNL